MARRVDRDEELSELRHEVETEWADAQLRESGITSKWDDPWWPANQEPIPEQYRKTPPA